VTHLELDVLVLHRFDVEPDCRDGCYDLSDLQPVQDGRLSTVDSDVVSTDEEKYRRRAGTHAESSPSMSIRTSV
jgi:hypothetical protein